MLISAISIIFLDFRRPRLVRLPRLRKLKIRMRRRKTMRRNLMSENTWIQSVKKC